MRVLVTGGCGFIGSHFIRVVLSERPDWEVVNIDALTYAGNLTSTLDIQTHPRYRFIYGSIADKGLVETLVKSVDAVVNFAAETHVDRSIVDNEPFIMTNVFGTQRLVDACVKYGKRFHHVSTDEVFGSLTPTQPKFNELTPYDPRNPYSATKAASDYLVRAAVHTHGLRATISNCTNNYGPFLYPEKFLSISITNLLEGRPVHVHGDGSQVRDWIHVRDHARGVLAVLERGTIGETYMMGGDAELTVRETAELLIRLMGVDANMLTFIGDRPGQDRRYAIDSSKIERELGWTRQFTIEEGLRHMVDWYRANESWWRTIKAGAHYREWYARQFGNQTCKVTPTPIEDLMVFEPDVFTDSRGFFMESFNAEKFATRGLHTEWKQDSHSFSVKGTLRGLHFQLPPKAQAKLVRCTRGKVWDVAVDLRRNSPTYRQWFGLELSAENKKVLYIPAGFAHGFYALEDAEFVYKCSHTFAKELDAGILWNDPDLNIAWPLTGEPILSPRDATAPRFTSLNLPF